MCRVRWSCQRMSILRPTKIWSFFKQQTYVKFWTTSSWKLLSKNCRTGLGLEEIYWIKMGRSAVSTKGPDKFVANPNLMGLKRNDGLSGVQFDGYHWGKWWWWWWWWLVCHETEMMQVASFSLQLQSCTQELSLLSRSVVKYSVRGNTDFLANLQHGVSHWNLQSKFIIHGSFSLFPIRFQK